MEGALINLIILLKNVLSYCIKTNLFLFCIVADDGGGVRHTYGPVDGSLYAVVRTETTCPGSMDSGISSSTVRLEQHRELDKLLSDMLLTVRDIPDPDIPYHARLDSRPFTYGGLASPSLVRKASPQQQASPDFHEG